MGDTNKDQPGPSNEPQARDTLDNRPVVSNIITDHLFPSNKRKRA